jgi:hypothetical protein
MSEVIGRGRNGRRGIILGHTQMWILFILIPSCPEERTYTTCAFNSSIWEIERHNHGRVKFRFETYDMRSECFGLFGILLEAVGVDQLGVVVCDTTFLQYSHQPDA